MSKFNKKKKPQKTTIFIRNSELINDAVIKYIKDNGGAKVPTQKEIATITKLHVNTIAAHYRNLKFEPSGSVQRSFTPVVINNLLALTKK